MDRLISWVKKNMFFVVGLLLTLGLLWPFFAAPYFTHHDDIQAVRLYEMDKCFKDGQIPCRWVPDLGGLYGYPLFNFYAPLPYYYGELFYFLTGSLLLSAKIMFATAFIAAYIFMFLLARKLWGNLGGLVSGVFYSFAPYHAVDLYVRGAMEELWGLMLFPAIFWALLRLKENTRISNALILGLFLGMLILSHNISSMLFLPSIIAFAGVLFYQHKDLRFLKIFTLSLVLGFSLSAFYFLPMVIEKNLVHVETMTGGYFSYTEHFKGVKKLFIERMWGWGASVREIPGAERDGMSFQIGWIHLLSWLAALFSAQKLWQKNKKLSLTIIFFSLLTLVSIFMVHPRSVFIWNLIEPLKYVQFPWRFLMLITFFISLLSGSLVMIAEKRKAVVWVVISILLVVVFNFGYFRPEKFLQITDAELLSGAQWDKQIKRSIFDFLPIYAQEPPAELATSKYSVVVGKANVRDFAEGTNWFHFKADVEGHTILQISKYYFPNWRILVDGKEAVVEYKNNHLGLMTLILGTGSYYIEGRLYDTQVRSLANVISFVGIAVFLLLVPTQIPRTRRWLSYYLKGMNR